MKLAAIVMIAAMAALAGCATVGSPTIDQFISPDNPRLSWLEVDGAAQYEVQIAADQNFTQELQNLPATKEASMPVRDYIAFNRSYFWRVRAIDADGFYGPWSPSGYFMLKLPAPMPTSPIGEIHEGRPVMKWDKTPAAARYDVQVSSDELFHYPEVDYHTTAKDYFPALPPGFAPKPGVKYYWRVLSVDARGSTSDWSKTVNFTVVRTFQPAKVSPAGGEVVAALAPTFTWSEYRDATGYQVEVIPASQMASAEPEGAIRESTKGPVATLTLSKALKPDTEYAWRVRPLLADGPGQWSAYEKFRTPKP